MRRTLSLLVVMSLASIWATGLVNTINTIAGGGAQSNPAYLGGAMTAYAGTDIAGFSDDGGAAKQAQLNFPIGLAIDKGNNLLISNQNNERIRGVDALPHNITMRKESFPRGCEMLLPGCL